MHMDIQQFVAGASEPMWVKPHWHQEHVKIINFHDRDVDNNDNENICSDEAGFAENSGAVNVVERAKELDDAATTLNTLCAANSPLADVQDFLAGWKDSSSAGRILSNALAWFNDSNAVRWACAHGSRDMVRALLENGLHPTPTAVSCACANAIETGTTDIIKLLVDFRWNINKSLNNNTPPLICLLLGNHEMVRWCLSLGADPNASSLSGNTVMQRAASYASLDTLKLLVLHGGLFLKGALIAHASYSHNLGRPERMEIVRFLSEHNAPIDAFYLDNRDAPVDECDALAFGKQNAIHFAIWGGKMDMVKLLIERGADKNLPTWSSFKTNGETISPVELALKFGHEDIAELLESPDLDVKA